MKQDCSNIHELYLTSRAKTKLQTLSNRLWTLSRRAAMSSEAVAGATLEEKKERLCDFCDFFYPIIPQAADCLLKVGPALLTHGLFKGNSQFFTSDSHCFRTASRPSFFFLQEQITLKTFISKHVSIFFYFLRPLL